MIDNLLKYKDIDGLYDEIITRNSYNILPGELKDAVVIDIGANIGVFSMNAIRLGAKSVLAFEPGDYAFSELEKNVKGLSVTPFNAAISDNDGIVKLHVGEPWNTCFTICDNLRNPENDITIDVKSISYKSLMPILKGLNSKLILKSDCEGAEHLFMYDREFLDLFSIIYIEIHELNTHSIISCVSNLLDMGKNVIETTPGLTNITYKITK